MHKTCHKKHLNPLKTSPEYTRAGVYGKCMLKENQIVFNGLNNEDTDRTNSLTTVIIYWFERQFSLFIYVSWLSYNHDNFIYL